MNQIREKDVIHFVLFFFGRARHMNDKLLLLF